VNAPRGPDFLGLGAQKAATSWIYRCLDDHPQLCIPMKELHFFSRDRNWSRGTDWYEQQFARCGAETLAGEFSTSYLADSASPDRIFEHYPTTKLLACLRNPADRAFSNFLNDLQAGVMPPETTFDDAVAQHPEYVRQGRYATQLERYLHLFSRDTFLIVLYDDIERKPLEMIQSMYRHLGVDDTWVPSMLHERVNVARIPRSVMADRLAHKSARFFRRCGLDRAVSMAKRNGVHRVVNRLNARPSQLELHALTPELRRTLVAEYEQDVYRLERLLDRDLSEWRR
jgi:hypothetical protein